ncbi:baseplate J/gp47 family protein [Desulfosporosinus sp. PR]|uniref:baseplate J/gp47 family protein n=1 Tax=Candidatus Desulfosporosinus nitrosoreducens TaxID=3401928 RepID=UPI0027E77CC9|nr:baseplate J/gp47 family protein [Desulfosporosinus sp. PR]MDQ7094226.1 baseplate J/gp47 family protein [Desulfosporosinus sp. PR]
MAYVAPYIDAAGLHLPSYQDILNDLIQQAKNIFGQGIYLGIDSQDYQFISTFAYKMNDTMQAIQLAYNSRGPGTAIGPSLDGLIKLNGIKRSVPTYSTCPVTLTGISNTVIYNGVIQDQSGYKWSLPATVIIGTNGTVDSTVTCQTVGPIVASAGEINIIATPTYGWTTVVNNAAATLGTAIETDSQLKARQAISTAQPSLTVLEGTKGAIAALPGVTRFKVYENDTSAPDSNGLPAHSITVLVEGGSDADIAKTIYNKKGPGCLANGTTVVNITDQYGQVMPIGFYRPTYVDVDVVINVKQLTGYTSAMTTAIQAAIAAFLNGMAMGATDIPVNNFFGSALSAQDILNPTYSVTSITACRHGETPGTADITTAFNEAVRGNVDYITINVS